MPSKRTVVFANDQYYHVFNRGVERRTIFTNIREYQRMVDTLWYYRHSHLLITLSAYFTLPVQARDIMCTKLNQDSRYFVSIISSCLMPNHFHLLIRQQTEHGIQKFMANIQNSYTKFFNTKHKRVGPLLQGTFKAVRIETDEQLLHVSRYIHLNPVTSYIVPKEQLSQYKWSSFPDYVRPAKDSLYDTSIIRGLIKTPTAYLDFVTDQITYAITLGKIKHLKIDEETE